jgi:hypothetical protein
LSLAEVLALDLADLDYWSDVARAIAEAEREASEQT